MRGRTATPRPRAGGLAALLAVLVALTGLLGLPVASAPLGVASAVRAAETDLTLVTNAGYVVDPANGRVRVTVDITAVNHKADTATKRFYFDRAFLAVQPGTTGFAISGATKPGVSVSRKTAAFTMLQISFGQRLYGGKSATFRLAFDLPDPGGSPDREVRVGDSLVAFPVWAFASDGATGSTVSVTFPAGYAVTFEQGELPRRSTGPGGAQVFATDRLAAPTSFFAYAVAERAGATADVPLEVAVGGQPVRLTLRAWADDPAWAERVGGTLEAALPVLGEEIGLPWPHEEPLVVAEALSRAEGGYAGRFDPGAGRIEVAYWAAPIVVVHEAAHGWFSGAFVAERWANEGFASHYADLAAARLGIAGEAATLTDEVAAARIPLNAWGPAGEPDAAVEAYGYAASRELARLVAERAGEDGLRRAWQWAADGVAPYGDPAGEAVGASATPAVGDDGDATPPDWRGLLDLLDEATGESFDDLWRTWVVRPEEVALLDARLTAREALTRTDRLAGDWSLPVAARDAMRAWDFPLAERILADARTVLAQRRAVEQAADAAGLVLPDGIRAPFEAGDLVAASELAATQFNAIAVLDGALAYRPADPDPLTTIGLLGEEPDLDLELAHEAFARGEVDAALAGAVAAQETWQGAWEEGRRRALFAIALLAAAALLVAAVSGSVRRRRGRRGPKGSAVAVGTGPGATGELPPSGT